MQEKMLKLLKLLAEDDNFALVFDEAQSIEEKFNLAKSKCKSLQKDGFVKFLLEFQAEQLEVNEKELSKVSGGVDKKSLVTKLTALAMLGMTFGPMSSVGMTSAMKSAKKGTRTNENIFYTQVVSEGRGPNTNAPNKKQKRQVKNAIDRLRNEWWGDYDDTDKIEVTAGGKTYTMDKDHILHTVVGEFHLDKGVVSGSHSAEVNTEIMQKMNQNNVKWACESNTEHITDHKCFNAGILTKDNYWTNLENVINEVMSSTNRTDVTSDPYGNRHCYKATCPTASCDVEVVVDDSGNVITVYPG